VFQLVRNHPRLFFFGFGSHGPRLYRMSHILVILSPQSPRNHGRFRRPPKRSGRTAFFSAFSVSLCLCGGSCFRVTPAPSTCTSTQSRILLYWPSSPSQSNCSLPSAPATTFGRGIKEHP
jgi:hypothetical protein